MSDGSRAESAIYPVHHLPASPPRTLPYGHVPPLPHGALPHLSAGLRGMRSARPHHDVYPPAILRHAQGLPASPGLRAGCPTLLPSLPPQCLQREVVAAQSVLLLSELKRSPTGDKV